MNRAPTTRFRVSELAKLARVSVRTLHHYDRSGLLAPRGRSDGGYRLYGEEDLTATLRMQREAIAEQRRRLEAATAAIEQAELTLAGRGVPDRDAFKTMMEVLTMTQQWEFVNKYYSEEQLASLRSRWSPELQQQAERDWAELIRDVEAALSDDPAGERGQALAARWSALVGAFTGGDPEIAQNLDRLYADLPTWPATAQKPYSDEVERFICTAQAVQRGE